MPKPHAYKAKTGRVTYKVRFRLTGRSCSETFDTVLEAKRFCADIEHRGADEALRLLDAERDGAQGPTLDELAEGFFTWKALGVRSDRTVADYRRDYRRAIADTLGWRRADLITDVDVQRWIDDLRTILAPKTVADRHALLHGIYVWAMSPSGNRAVTHNPCIGTDLPARIRGRPKGLRPAEWQALEPALRQIDADGADLALFLLSTGWRWSEATAVDVFDVEDDGVSLHVTMGRVVRRNAAGQHVIVDDAKSAAGLRRVGLDSGAAEMVRRRIGNRTSGLVFTTRTGAQWHYANFLNRIWKPAVKVANLSRQPTPHWLRHTHVYWMAPHTTPGELQRRIGHESIKTTMGVYGSMIEDVFPAALDAFAQIRGGSTRQKTLVRSPSDTSSTTSTNSH